MPKRDYGHVDITEMTIFAIGVRLGRTENEILDANTALGYRRPLHSVKNAIKRMYETPETEKRRFRPTKWADWLFEIFGLEDLNGDLPRTSAVNVPKEALPKLQKIAEAYGVGSEELAEAGVRFPDDSLENGVEASIGEAVEAIRRTADPFRRMGAKRIDISGVVFDLEANTATVHLG